MSDVQGIKEIFNVELKEKYLSELVTKEIISEATKVSYRRIFNHTADIEFALDKDISEFKFEELETVLRGFEATNRNTVESYARIISSYLNWCVKEGIIEVNHLAHLKPDDFISYLKKGGEEYISDSQLRRYEDICTNYQDAVVLRLLFIGVGGKQMSELRNLKKTDVDFHGMRLKLTNSLKEDDKGNPVKYTERYIDVDDRTLTLIQGAMNETTYQKKNGHMDFRDNIRPYTDLVDNDYVLRASITKTDRMHGTVDKFVIHRRVKTVSDFLGLDKSFTAKFIQKSGMLYMASQIIKNEEVTLDDYKMIADRFNIKSYHNLKGLITMDIIRSIYPIEKITEESRT